MDLLDDMPDTLATVFLAYLVWQVLSRDKNSQDRSYGVGERQADMRYVLINISFAPITCMFVLLLISVYYYYLHKNWDLLYKQDIALNPAKILQQGEYYRLVTGQLIHGSTEHLCANMVALCFLGQEEYIRTRNYHNPANQEPANHRMTGGQYFCYFVMIILVCGIANVSLIRCFQPEDMDRHGVGFSGVIFALETLGNCDRSDYSNFRMPYTGRQGRVRSWSMPWLTLVAISVSFPAASFWGHLAGIVTGYVFAWLWKIRTFGWPAVWQGPHKALVVGLGAIVGMTYLRSRLWDILQWTTKSALYMYARLTTADFDPTQDYSEAFVAYIFQNPETFCGGVAVLAVIVAVLVYLMVTELVFWLAEN